MRLIYHPDAESELLEAVRFYERRVPGLGRRFRREFDAAVARIEETPDRWRLVDADIRRYLIPGFPYSILYRVEGEQWRILVVKHDSIPITGRVGFPIKTSAAANCDLQPVGLAHPGLEEDLDPPF